MIINFTKKLCIIGIRNSSKSVDPGVRIVRSFHGYPFRVFFYELLQSRQTDTVPFSP